MSWLANWPVPAYAINIHLGKASKSNGKSFGGSALQQEFLKTSLDPLEVAVSTYAVTELVACNYSGIPRLVDEDG